VRATEKTAKLFHQKATEKHIKENLKTIHLHFKSANTLSVPDNIKNISKIMNTLKII
jgi:hypothetical protein